MVTKLEAGHKYRDKVFGVFIYLDEDEDGYLIYSPGSMGITGLQHHLLDLSTLVEVCFVNGEEMIVGAEYEVAVQNCRQGIRTFVGVLEGKPYFSGNSFCWPWPCWKLVEPVLTYHLVKSIDGKEVSRVEVSEEKAGELCGRV